MLSSETAFYERASTSLLCATPAIILPDDSIDQDWEDFRNYLEMRLAALRDWRISWWYHWADLATHILPRRYHWLVTPNTMIRGREINRAITDTTVVKAFRTCCAGLMSGLTSPSRPWFKLGVGGFQEEDIPRDWQLWLDEVERRIYKVMSGSNFYDCLMQLFQDLVCFGTAPMLIYEDVQDIIRCYNPCAGEYYLANGGDFRVNTFYRTFVMTVVQMIDFFGYKNLPAEITGQWSNKGARLDMEYVIAHAIEPNFAATRPQDPNKRLGVVKGGYDYREVYWLYGRSSAKPISMRGFYDKPYIAPRWETTSNDAYGRSVGMDVLPDIKQLYLMQKRLAEAIEKQLRPPMQADVGLKNHPAAITPGAVTYVADVQKGGMRPIYEITPDIAGMLNQMQALQERVKDGFYTNLFMMISQMEGVQPRNEMELTERKNEQMQELGPVIEKFQTEGAGPAITRIYSILKRNRMLPQMPQSMMGHPITIGYINMLTIAQRAAKTAGMERGLNVAGGFLKAGKPEAMDIIDEDEFMREYLTDLTFPTKIIRSPDQLKEIRMARQKAQQSAAAAHGAATMAPALADASTAAKNFSEIGQGGGMQAIQQMMGPSGLPNAGQAA
jgi:hypothetical protein